MQKFWHGMIAGGILGAIMSMHMDMDKKRQFVIGTKRTKQAARIFKGVSRSMKEMVNK